MSYKRKVTVLGAAAAILLLTFAFGEIFSPQRMGQAASDSLLFPGFPKDGARKIELATGSGSVKLSRAAEWALDIDGTLYPASTSKVGSLLQEIAGLTRGKLVTRGKDKDAELGMTGSQAVHLTVTGEKGEVLCELYAGKTSPDGRGRYIRVGKEAEVFDTGESLSAYVSAEKRFWENLRIFPEDLKAESVSGVSVKADLALSAGKEARKLDYVLNRSTDAQGRPSWAFASGSPTIAPEKVRSLIDALVALEGNDFDTGADAVRQLAAKSQATIVVSTDKARFTLFVGARMTGDQYSCALENGANAYLVPEWRIEQALPTRESFTAKAP